MPGLLDFLQLAVAPQIQQPVNVTSSMLKQYVNPIEQSILDASQQRMRNIEQTTKDYSQDPEAYGQRMRAINYATDVGLPKTYKGFQPTVDRLANVIEQNPDITAAQLYFQHKQSLPSVIKKLPENQAIPALQAFKEFQLKSSNLGAEEGFTLGRMPLLHKSVESAFFTKATGDNNFGGVKVTSGQREKLQQLYKKEDLKKDPNLSYPFDKGIVGAKQVTTSEVLKAKNKQDAVKEAEKTYSQFGQEVLDVKYDLKRNKWVAKIKDLFVNYENIDNAIANYKQIALKKTK